MSNSKRIHRTVGRPALLDDIERVYRVIWLQPHSESQVPFRAKVYDSRDLSAWMGYRADDTTQLEITWLKTLWKQVSDPFADEVTVDIEPETLPPPMIEALPPPLPIESSESSELHATNDTDDETTQEVPT